MYYNTSQIRRKNASELPTYLQEIVQNHANTLCKLSRKGNVNKVIELMKDEKFRSLICRRSGIFGYMPIHEAASNRKHETIDLLLKKYDASVDATTNWNYTALHIAASIGDVKCIETLLNYNADIMLVDDFGKTPYQTAVDNKRANAARLLKTAGKISY